MGRSITRGTVDAGERSQYPILAIVKPRGCVAELLYLWFFFFFSSRRRHTRLTCDWSSDVCSSDLSLDPWTLTLVSAVRPWGTPSGPRARALTRPDPTPLFLQRRNRGKRQPATPARSPASATARASPTPPGPSSRHSTPLASSSAGTSNPPSGCSS